MFRKVRVGDCQIVQAKLGRKLSYTLKRRVRADQLALLVGNDALRVLRNW